MKNEIIEIPVELVLDKTMELKKAGMRLSQACAASVDDKLELSYSFADDSTYDYTTLRVVIDPEVEVRSITEIVPQAVFYENEMKELFGVNIRMISLDYQNKLYRIEEDAPMGPHPAAKASGTNTSQAVVADPGAKKSGSDVAQQPNGGAAQSGASAAKTLTGQEGGGK